MTSIFSPNERGDEIRVTAQDVYGVFPSNFPDPDSVVLGARGEELLVWRPSQTLQTFAVSFQSRHFLARLCTPKDDAVILPFTGCDRVSIR
jgi:hypothetical protein